MKNYIRIWNERSRAIGGRGAAVVIDFLQGNGFDTIQTDADEAMPDHEGVAVAYESRFKAGNLVELNFGRGCPA